MSWQDAGKKIKIRCRQLRARFRKTKNRWKLLGLLLLAVVIFRYRAYRHQQVQQANQEAVAVVRTDLVKQAIRAGTIELQGVLEVRPPLTGVLTQLNVENGQRVAAGEVLFKVKSTATDSQQAAAWSAYLNAKNTFEDAQITIGNTEWAAFEAAKANVIAAEKAVEEFEREHPDQMDANNKDYQELLQGLKVARLNVDMQVNVPARIDDRLENARADYLAALAQYNATKDGTYRAPTGGRVENLGVRTGENVTADVGDKNGTALFLLIPDGHKTVSMQIGANDVTVLKVGQEAMVKSDLAQEATFAATIVRIDRVGKQNGDKGLTYRAWLEVVDDHDELLLGSPVEVIMETSRAQNVLAIPWLAIHDNQVTVVDADKNIIDDHREIGVGIKSNGLAEVSSGLSDGEYVLVDNN